MSGETVFETATYISSPTEIQLKSREVSVIESVDVKGSHPPRLSEAFDRVLKRTEVELLIRRFLEPTDTQNSNVDLVKYHLRPYSTEKIGFLGSHLCLVAQIRTANRDESAPEENREISFFVKTLPWDVPSQAAYIEEKGCFKKEAQFYERLVPLMMRKYKGTQWLPNCYFVKPNVLVLEDLKVRGFAPRPRQLFDEKTARAAMACLARLHASSLLAEEQLDGKNLGEVFPELVRESEYKRNGRCYEWYSNAMDLAVYLARRDFGFSEDSCKTILSASKAVLDLALPSTTKRNVLSHGDIWSSNLLFNDSKVDLEDDLQALLVDVQLTRYSPLAHDPVQLLHLTTSRSFREEKQKAMLEYYHACLIETLKMSSYEGKVPELEEVMQGAEEQKYPAVVAAAIFLPTVLMDGKTGAKIMDNTDSYEHYYFRDRKPFVDEIMSRDEEYAQRLRETFRELAELSLIADTLPRLT
ncbi:hypothetical protein QAD02_016323 [Eretmocerus hayati]|uniref:Uncharacterized protein n=1 Tax=Eretmocerus hayati TaxID=131215 RepID=A0ACC2PC06_9HYME|nr:hypothetical protein QAD02_016323 [Eretmocerus hayati]